MRFEPIRQWSHAEIGLADGLIPQLRLTESFRALPFWMNFAEVIFLDAVMLGNVEMLELKDAVFEIVEAYLARKLMPADPFGDALHLALASYHRCDFLVTWNCQHLANANKFGQIRRINGILGLFVPELVTPMELLGENAGP